MRFAPDWRAWRVPLVALAATQLAGLALGAALVHAGHAPALAFRDALVARAHASDPSALANDRGDHLRAAALDVYGNFVLGAVPQAFGGLALVLPFALGAYRGFVGGVVSVDAAHHSRLVEPASATYFVVVVALQLAGYTLAGAGGVRAGLDFLRTRRADVPRFLTIPRACYRTILVGLAWSLPFFVAGSLVEFLA